MGGSRPRSKTVSKTKSPKVIKTVIPLQSYQQAAEYNQSLRNDTQGALNSLYQMTGTPTQVGARMRGYEMQEAADHAAATPVADRFMLSATGGTDPYAASRTAATNRLSDAQTAYAQALQHVNDTPAPLSDRSNPAWAQSTIPQGMPSSTTTPTPTPTPTASTSHKHNQTGSRAWFNNVMENSNRAVKRVQST